MVSYITWNVDPEIFTLFGFPIRFYGVLFGLGLLLSIYVLSWIFKKENISNKDLDTLTLYGIFGIVIGARLGHCLFYEPDYYFSHPLEMLLPVKFVDGGMQFMGYQGLASHGGVLGLIIAIYAYSRKTKQSMLATIDFVAIVAGLAFGFIRLANFTNSEIVGIPTTKAWGIIFERIDMVPRHPAQLYEAFSYFLVFGILMFLYVKMRDRFNNGFYFGLATILFFTARILIEFVKENQVGFEDGMILNMGQILSLPYILVGITIIWYSMKNKDTHLK